MVQKPTGAATLPILAAMAGLMLKMANTPTRAMAISMPMARAISFPLNHLAMDLDTGAGHFTAASEEHEAEACHLGASGHAGPPGTEPLVEGGGLEPVGDAYVLDGRSKEHHAGSEDAGEAYAHLVEDDARYDEESADVEDVLRCGIRAEYVGAPSPLLFYEALQRTHHVHEHIAEEHHERDEDQGCPSCCRIIV